MPQLSANPARKRPRLSLKAAKKAAVTKTDICDVTGELQNSTKERKDEVEDIIPDEDTADVQSTPEESNQGPGIIGFENLGNTCFLNSVLQILRYMPGFLEGLESTNKDIIQAEKLQSEVNDHMKKEHGDGFEKPDDCLSWQVVRILQQLFTRMENREKKFRHLGRNSAVSTMTVKPERLLDKIRQINPMFEGYLQHDAQELLRCLLCYLQDAHKEVVKVNMKKKEIDVKKSSGVTTIARYFGKRSSSKNKADISVVKNELSQYNAKMALFQDGDKIKLENKNYTDKQCTKNTETEKDEVSINSGSNILSYTDMDCMSYDEIDSLPSASASDMKKIPSNSDLTSLNSNKSCNRSPREKNLVQVCDTLKSSAENSSEPLNLAQMPTSNVGSCQMEVETYVLDDNEVHSEHIPTTFDANRKSLPSCAGGRRSKTIKLETASITPDPMPKKRGYKRKKCLSDTVLANLKDESISKEAFTGEVSMESSLLTLPVSCSKSQPSVLSLFGKREAGCKRLGMRGAAVSKVCNGQEAPNTLQDKAILETAKTTSCHPNHTGDPPTNIQEMTKLEISPMDTSAQPVTQQDISIDFLDSIRPVVKDESLESVAHIETDVSKKSQLRSPSKRYSGVMEHVSEKNLKSAALQDIKQAKVKLEKCDPVCSSPFKSVSAVKAIKRLGAPMEKQKDFIEELFQGEMMLRTRCMECECSRERREIFQDVSVPLKNFVPSNTDLEDSDEEQEEASLSCLMSAFSDVERLCDDNKYFCENCYSYVEAERSLHYETLPEVLTLHLKRFAASSGFLGNLTKINDHIVTPDYLPCLRYKCPRPCQRTDHRYKLFGLIAHSGLSITSGHYMSYVRLLANSRPVRTFVEEKTTPVSKNSLNKVNIPSDKDLSVKPKPDLVDGSCATGSAMGAAALPEDTVPPNKKTSACKVQSDGEEYVNKWLECDDDFVQVLNDDDFDRRLAPNSGYNAAPYVLFYIKDNDFI